MKRAVFGIVAVAMLVSVRCRALVLLVVCSLVVLVCGGSLSAWAAPTEQADFTRVTVKSAGISLEYPRNWTVFVLTPKVVRAQRKALVKNNPELADGVDAEAQLAAAKKSKFSAGDVEAKANGTVGGAVDVQVNSGFAPRLADETAALVEGYKQAGATVLGTSSVRVSGRRCARVDLKLAANGSTARISQLLAPLNGRSIVVTTAASDDVIGAATIDHVLTSVRSL